MDFNLHYVFASPSVAKLYGYSPEEFITQPLERIMSPESFQNALRAFEEEMALEASGTADPRRTRVIESLEYRKDGSTVWIENTLSFIRDADSKAVQTLCVAKDITERKQAEETRARLEAQLRQSQKMEAVGQLAGGVAHDFNNLLTVIIGNANLLASESDLGLEMPELVRQITTAADRAANLTRQLLTFSRRQVMQVRPLNLNEVLSNISKMLHRLLGEHIALQCNYAPDLPHIEADAGMLEQVVVNLAVNARDAMPKGGCLVLSTQTEVLGPEEARHSPEACPGQFVLLTVADTGCGMDPTTLARIFEPFFTTKDVGKGTGLGLATVYGIVKQHNGWIEVASQLERGTTFKVFLPAAATAGQRPTPASAQPTTRGGHETILVVEDEAAVRQVAVMCLRRLGYQVLEAGNGVEALRLWEGRQRRIDLLLTDMVMPEGLSGLDLAERLRLDQPELRVILCTGYSLELSLRGQPIQPGLVHLAKPFNTRQLAESVRRCLDGNATDGP
ncbi:MAG: ATP-binding protein [Verrucomicrobiota bacterium]